jgi:hypothetical protein
MMREQVMLSSGAIGDTVRNSSTLSAERNAKVFITEN